jgi:quercetin dioxygenase-like cupin family protein
MGRFLKLEDAPDYVPPGHSKVLDKVLVDRNTVGAENVVVWYGYLEPEAEAEAHVHSGSEQVYFVIKGKIRFEVDGETFIGVPNSVTFVPRGSRHALKVLEEKAEMLVITAPPAH